MKREIVINSDYGGFGLSDKAIERLFELKGWNLVKEDYKSFITLYYRDEIKESNLFNERDLPRDSFDLVQVVKELGHEASGRFASLKIVTIPSDVEWVLMEHDGREWIAEKHRTWE